MWAETVIKKLNKRGYTVSAKQDRNNLWDIELYIITATGLTKVYEVSGYYELSTGLELILFWLDSPWVKKEGLQS